MPTITHKGKQVELTQRMFDMLEWAVKYPRADAWHAIGKDDEDAEAARSLAEVGLIELRAFLISIG